MLRAAILTTAGSAEGRGHAARARSVAEALVDAGASVSVRFRAGGPTPSEAAWYVAHGALDDPPGQPDVVVVDLPQPRADDVPDPRRAAVFDDRETFDGEAAVVVQPSLPEWRGRATAGRVLAGWAYAPIAAAWRSARDADRPSTPRARRELRVLVCFGGSDPAAVTARLSPAIAARSAWRTTVVVGPDYAGPDAGLDLLRDPADLPGLVRGADLVVLGAGTMKFEVACLGRPSVLLAVADDQLPVGPAFAATGAARWLGDGRSIDPEIVVREIEALFERPGELASMASAGPMAVDGRGAQRLASELLSLGCVAVPGDTRAGLGR